jgi:hypothetical protein
MLSKGLLYAAITANMFLLSACNYSEHDHTPYDSEYIASGDYKTIYDEFVPYATYRIELRTISGDADLAVYDTDDELVVFSEEPGVYTDVVIFTASDYDSIIEIYGHHNSEYQLYIEELPYDDIGLNAEFDGVDFNIGSGNFTGDLYSILASKSMLVSHDYDYLTITPVPDPAWLDVTPTGTLYNNSSTITINILETESPAANNFATVFLDAQDVAGKVSVFKEVDVVYRIRN